VKLHGTQQGMLRKFFAARPVLHLNSDAGSDSPENRRTVFPYLDTTLGNDAKLIAVEFLSSPSSEARCAYYHRR
jgi:hypothetical protein